MKQIHIGILGLGTVGTGIARLLAENGELISSRLGAELHLKKAADLDIERDRGIDFAPGVLTTDPYAVVNDPEIDIVLEMIGGMDIARELIMKGIENGKHIVTANKALLATRGNEIVGRAAQKGLSLAFEASVGGCMPIIKTIRESLVGNNIHAVTGILNGTCNYILTRIAGEGISFEAALEMAKAEGYAEANPSLDVDGYDTAHKLAILSAIAFGMKINYEDVYIEGIAALTPMDIEFAAQCGYRIKLLAITKSDGKSVEARVHPAMIPFTDLLSNVSGSMNAVTVTADAVGDMILYGHGAGMMPTASAAIGDVVDIARCIVAGGAMRVPMLGYQMEHIREIPIKPMDEIETHYYFRFSALDKPGVLARIAGILGEHDISIKFVHQTKRRTNGAVPVYMLTHQAREAQVKQALDKIAEFDFIPERPVLIRIEAPEEQKSGQGE
ncbi:MAG: homoserine dehydrogenase [Desulfobacterales bacterium]|nr:homoserine dehydrogenase [Desulfobacterales bacterium]